MQKRTFTIVFVLTALMAFMDISGLPAILFVKPRLADVDPIYFALMSNFLIIAAIAIPTLKFMCPEWHIGFGKLGFTDGIKHYGWIALSVSLIGLLAFWVGLIPFDKSPSVAKVLIEGVIYYIGVAIIEEWYVRGLLLNLIEKLFGKKRHATAWGILLSSLIFGLGHIFGTIGQPPFVMISKVVWTICMGLFFGTVYKKCKNLWVPILFHFTINVCALPYCFSTVAGYADLTLAILLPTYLLLGAYSLILIKKDQQM